MSTYQKEEIENCITTYRVPIELDYDETVFNGSYLKNNSGDLVYFGLLDIDGNYDNNLENIDLSTCIMLTDYTDTETVIEENIITLEKVNNTVAKIFINKLAKKLTLNRRAMYIFVYFIDEYKNTSLFFKVAFYPKECSYKYLFKVYSFLNLATNVNFSFNKLYFVCNYNGTGGTIDIELLKLVNYLDIDNTLIDKKILMLDDYSEDMYNIFKNNINSLIYTYYSSFNLWYLYESGYTPQKLLESDYDIYYLAMNYNNSSYGLFDYGNNTAYSHGDSNWNKNGLFYLCAINEEQLSVVPIFRTDPINLDRPGTNDDYTYTVYILK